MIAYLVIALVTLMAALSCRMAGGQTDSGEPGAQLQTLIPTYIPEGAKPTPTIRLFSTELGKGALITYDEDPQADDKLTMRITQIGLEQNATGVVSGEVTSINGVQVGMKAYQDAGHPSLLLTWNYKSRYFSIQIDWSQVGPVDEEMRDQAMRVVASMIR